MIKVDFTGVSLEGGKLLPEGPIQLELDEIEEMEGEESGKPYLQFKWKVSDGGDDQGVVAYDNMSLQPQALWKLRGCLEAMGVATEEGTMDIDPEELIGLNVIGDIIHEPYKGKNKHRVNGYSQVEEGTTQPAPSASKAVVKKRTAASTESEWSVKQKVSFQDGKRTLSGVITELDGDKVTVRVSGEKKKDDNGDYEMEVGDLTAA